MIKKLLLLSLIVFAVSCKDEASKEGYVLNGSIDKAADGEIIRLRNGDLKAPEFNDSTVIKNGTFTFKGKVQSPDLFILAIDKAPGGIPIILENTEITVNVNKDSIPGSTVSGSHENDIFNVFKELSDPLRRKNQSMGRDFMAARTAGDTQKMNSIQAQFKVLMDSTNQLNIDAIEKHNDAITSAVILENLVKTKSVDYAKADELNAAFTESVKNSRVGKSLTELLQTLQATDIGSTAPDFTAPNPTGEMVSLKDIKGKVTIIDFWAAWCGPCRKENPNVVNVYNKYHEKGLEIIGVSLDGNPRQANAKDEWIAAIEKDNLTWHHVSNLNYFNDPVAKLYNIESIPATFILDSEGKIIAKNLRGPALEAKMAELLD
ncbi:redoxin domain-containing protein [Bizionia sp. KMM 8389]